MTTMRGEPYRGMLLTESGNLEPNFGLVSRCVEDCTY